MKLLSSVWGRYHLLNTFFPVRKWFIFYLPGMWLTNMTTYKACPGPCKNNLNNFNVDLSPLIE